jgi:hypothetical protein
MHDEIATHPVAPDHPDPAQPAADSPTQGPPDEISEVRRRDCRRPASEPAVPPPPDYSRE